MPLKLLPDLQKKFPSLLFLAMDPNENLKPKNKELVLIDTILGIKKAARLDDINKIITDKIYSAHDFDLGLNLKLLHKLGYLKKATIFGLPPDIKKTEALKQLFRLISDYYENQAN